MTITDTKTITVTLRIENRYSDMQGVIVVWVRDLEIAPPPHRECEPSCDDYDDSWEQANILPHTGTGHESGDGFYDVEVVASSHPDLLAVGTTYEFGY